MRQLAALFVIALAFGVLESRGQVDKKQTDDDIFIEPEVMARFQGGHDSLISFIKRNLVVPTTCFKGRVFVEFYVNVDGSLSDIKIAKSLSTECDKVAIELVQKMPAWIPGILNSVPFRHRLVLPIKFE